MAPIDVIGLAPIILSGRVVDLQTGPVRPTNLTATIEVTDRWKGEVADHVTVYGGTQSSACQYSGFPLGKTVTLFLSQGKPGGPWQSGYSTDSCLMDTIQTKATDLPALLARFRAEYQRFADAVHASPVAPDALLDRAHFLERWRDPEAVSAYQDLARDRPDMVEAHLGVARSFLKVKIDLSWEKRVDAARAALSHVFALDPANVEVVRLRTQLEILSGDKKILATLRDFHDLIIGDLARSGENLRGVSFADARIYDLKLNGTDLQAADLRNLKATVADFSDARLDDANMAWALLGGANFARASLRRITAPDALLIGADLTGSALDDASLPGANLRRAKLIDATFGHARLVGANLTGANLDGADLHEADLHGADLHGALYNCRTRLPNGITPEMFEMSLTEPSANRCR